MSMQTGVPHSKTTQNDVKARTGRPARTRTLGQAMRRLAPLVLVAIVLAMASPLAADRRDEDSRQSFSVFTQNAYVGASIERVMAVDPTDPDPTALLTAVTTTYYEMLASKPEIRMRGIAARIADQKPDIVALQEMYTLRRQSPGDAAFGGQVPATEVVADFLHSLMDALAARDLHYGVAVVTTEFDIEMPMYNAGYDGTDDARLTDSEVILVRTDLPRDQMRVSNRQMGHFNTLLVLPGSGIEVLQGWCSVDVTVRGERFRFINAHLQDETFPGIQFAQAQELLAGPADTHLPVMLAGDLNADPLGRNGTQTYPEFINGGFTDAWTAIHPNLAGLTWGHDALLADRDVEFKWRIDLVLFKGFQLEPRKIETVETGLHRLQPPFWPSDHAGVSARFSVR